jgi:hypothetical protein
MGTASLSKPEFESYHEDASSTLCSALLARSALHLMFGEHITAEIFNHTDYELRLAHSFGSSCSLPTQLISEVGIYVYFDLRVTHLTHTLFNKCFVSSFGLNAVLALVS